MPWELLSRTQPSILKLWLKLYVPIANKVVKRKNFDTMNRFFCKDMSTNLNKLVKVLLTREWKYLFGEWAFPYIEIETP